MLAFHSSRFLIICRLMVIMMIGFGQLGWFMERAPAHRKQA